MIEEYIFKKYLVLKIIKNEQGEIFSLFFLEILILIIMAYFFLSHYQKINFKCVYYIDIEIILSD